MFVELFFPIGRRATWSFLPSFSVDNHRRIVNVARSSGLKGPSVNINSSRRNSSDWIKNCISFFFLSQVPGDLIGKQKSDCIAMPWRIFAYAIHVAHFDLDHCVVDVVAQKKRENKLKTATRFGLFKDLFTLTGFVDTERSSEKKQNRLLPWGRVRRSTNTQSNNERRREKRDPSRSRMQVTMTHDHGGNDKEIRGINIRFSFPFLSFFFVCFIPFLHVISFLLFLCECVFVCMWTLLGVGGVNGISSREHPPHTHTGASTNKLCCCL